MEGFGERLERVYRLAHELEIHRDELVVLALSYNGRAWLNMVIATIHLAGNRVRVKASAGREISARL